MKYVKFYEDLNYDLLEFLKYCCRDGKNMLISLGCIELVMFCGWLKVTSYGSENVGQNCSLCANGAYSFCVFLMVLHEEKMSAFT